MTDYFLTFTNGSLLFETNPQKIITADAIISDYFFEKSQTRTIKVFKAQFSFMSHMHICLLRVY